MAKRGLTVSRGTAVRIARVVKNWERTGPDPIRARAQSHTPQDVNGFPLLNNSGETIPARGIIRVVGVTVHEGRDVLDGRKPNSFGSQYMHFVNGPEAIPVAELGYCYYPETAGEFSGGETWALYDDGDGTPAAGESWGPREGTWKLRKNTGGFQVLGLISGLSNIARVVQAPMLTVAVTAADSFLYTETAEFTVGGSTLSAEVTNGFITDAHGYHLAWQAGGWTIIDPDQLVSGTSDGYYYAGDTGDFTVEGETVEALVRRGMTFDGSTYDLAWDGQSGRFLVLHPDLRFRGVANSGISSGSTSGSVSIYKWNGSAYADTGEDLSDVLAGPNVDIASSAILWCQFVAPTYTRAEIVQAQFECPEE